MILLEDGTDLDLEDDTAMFLEDGSSGYTTSGRRPPMTSRRTVQLFAPTYETLLVELWCSADPTGTVPRFAVTAEGTTITDTDEFSDGEWVEDYDTATMWTTASTPTIGSAGVFTIAADQRWWLWAQVTASSEVGISLVGTIISS